VRKVEQFSGHVKVTKCKIGVDICVQGENGFAAVARVRNTKDIGRPQTDVSISRFRSTSREPRTLFRASLEELEDLIEIATETLGIASRASAKAEKDWKEWQALR